MPRKSLASLLLVPLFAFASCDMLGPDGGNTRITLSRTSAGGSSAALIATSSAESHGNDRRGSNSAAVLALVEDLDVTVTAVQALPAQYLDRPNPESFWETMTLPGPATVDLLNLPADSTNGITLVEGDFAPGAYVRLRFLVSEIELTLAAPLTLDGRTFPAGEPIAVQLRDPWVRIPGAFFTVSEGETATVNVYFDPGATIGQLVVTDDGGLRFAPVMLGRNWRQDRD